MTRIAVIGEQVKVARLGLVGAWVLPADDGDAVRRAWQRLDPDVAVVILTQRAARYLGDEMDAGSWPLAVVMPP